MPTKLEQDRRDYSELLDKLGQVETKLENNNKEILAKFTWFKDNVCVPTRIEFNKDIAVMKVKHGMLSSVWGLVGGVISIGIKMLLKR